MFLVTFHQDYRNLDWLQGGKPRVCKLFHLKIDDFTVLTIDVWWKYFPQQCHPLKENIENIEYAQKPFILVRTQIKVIR